MISQTNTGEREAITGVLPEALCKIPEIERAELLAALTNDGVKDNLTMCSIATRESGKASAFAIYKSNGSIDIGNPILGEVDPTCHFGLDKTHKWGTDTGVDDLLDPTHPSYRQLFMCSDGFTPRKDVVGLVVAFPVGELAYDGFDAKKIRRPTKKILDFFVDHVESQPGFTVGILTDDGDRAGLLLFKKDEAALSIDSDQWGFMGPQDEIGRDIVLGQMSMAGIAYSEINLNFPKNCDPSKVFDKRMESAVSSIF